MRQARPREVKTAANSRIRLALWLFLCGFVAHEFEEWNLVEWQLRNFSPDPGFSAHQSRVLLTLIATAGVFFAAPCIYFLSERAALRVLIPLFVIPILGNALTHIAWLVLFGSYASGVVTSILILTPIAAYLIWISYVDFYLPRVLLAILVLLALIPAICAIHAGRTISPSQIEVQKAGARVADFIKPAA